MLRFVSSPYGVPQGISFGICILTQDTLQRCYKFTQIINFFSYFYRFRGKKAHFCNTFVTPNVLKYPKYNFLLKIPHLFIVFSISNIIFDIRRFIYEGSLCPV